MGKLFLCSLVLLLLTACENSGSASETISPTPSKQPTISIQRPTLIKEPKHPLEPEFTPYPTRTLVPTPIPELKSTFWLTFKKDPTPATAYFDFDTGGFNPSLQENDIFASLAIGTNVTAVISPVEDARQHAEKKKSNLDFDYEICNGSYGKGTVPVGGDTLYCWHTNQGKLIQIRFVSTEPGDLENGFRVNFEYLLWGQW